MQVNSPKLKALRDQRGWSQEHLAKAAGLGLRTIQRVEAEATASHETLLCVAAALEVEVSALIVVLVETTPQAVPTRRRSSLAPEDAPWFVRWPLQGCYTRREALGAMWMQIGVFIVTYGGGIINMWTVRSEWAGHFAVIGWVFSGVCAALCWNAIRWMDFHNCWSPNPRSGEPQS